MSKKEEMPDKKKQRIIDFCAKHGHDVYEGMFLEEVLTNFICAVMDELKIENCTLKKK